MAYDEGLAERIREELEGDARIREKRMFGGVAFLVNGKMALGIIGEELMVRVGIAAHAAACARPHAREMDFTGRRMRGFVQVRPAGFEQDRDLRAWIALGLEFAAQLPAKSPERRDRPRAIPPREKARKPKPRAAPRRR